MALTVRIAALGTRVEESSDVTNMRSALFSSVTAADLSRTLFFLPRPQASLLINRMVRVALWDRLHPSHDALCSLFVRAKPAPGDEAAIVR